MMPRILVYTCVFGGYDRVFPPVRRDPSIDYVLVTDDPGMEVPGWRTLAVDKARFKTAKAPNRYFKMLAHRQELGGYDVSVYVDGNIRVIGRTAELVAAFLASGAALGTCVHPARSSVGEEVERCLLQGKLGDVDRAALEIATYRAAGFDDRCGLRETGVVLKNHAHPALEPAMSLWWECFERYDSRDQISLPYVQWKLGLEIFDIEPGFRSKNPYFGIYPHARSGTAPARYAHCVARSFDDPLHAFLLKAWNGKWRLQRAWRRMTGRSA